MHTRATVLYSTHMSLVKEIYVTFLNPTHMSLVKEIYVKMVSINNSSIIFTVFIDRKCAKKNSNGNIVFEYSISYSKSRVTTIYSDQRKSLPFSAIKESHYHFYRSKKGSLLIVVVIVVLHSGVLHRLFVLVEVPVRV